MDLREFNARGEAVSEHASEARHPWERTRFEFFHRVLHSSGALFDGCEILDVGSGDAWCSSQIAEHNRIPPITCWDQDYHKNSSDNLGLDSKRIRLVNKPPKGRYDLILLLDVLEHVEHDRSFLRTIIRDNLRVGGRVLISVPAWKQLHSAHDRWLKHFRRYVPSEFRELIADANLQVDRKGGLFHSLLLPRSLGVLKESLKERLSKSPPREEEPTLYWQAGPLVTAVVMGALRLDNRLSEFASMSGLELPGLSLWALCEAKQA